MVDYNKIAYDAFSDLVVIVYAWNLNCQEYPSMAKRGHSLRRLFAAILMEWYPPPIDGVYAMTAMGFESAPTERWWYDFLDERYYVACDEAQWKPEYYRPWFTCLEVLCLHVRKHPKAGKCTFYNDWAGTAIC
ncbi:hypothetical protein SNOG_01829 [Parastagonospora nodorum SN15]|uniref:Uncharacterized protein n=1 Tax=Phaeosphaeria nodorum (strain SN15 / ATCC MYA-4574 / FGSC 10173) TaxID=321614 RepID=Q0V2D5_PHANO|nr:hypothetical protein SNOG_01829 [Parastagonospora nodorum SN15]EAT91478.1 hypothetical protein SNOG_01829 [Parastagonospora nodorum SN15]